MDKARKAIEQKIEECEERITEIVNMNSVENYLSSTGYNHLEGKIEGLKFALTQIKRYDD